MPPSKPAATSPRSTPGRRPTYVVDPTPAPGGVWLVSGLAVASAFAALWYGFKFMIQASQMSSGERMYLPYLGGSLALLLLGVPILFMAAWALLDGQRWSWVLMVVLAGAAVIASIYAAFANWMPTLLAVVIALAAAGITIYLFSATARDYFAPEVVKAKTPRKARPAAEEDEDEDEA